MFNESKYTTWYYNIIRAAQSRRIEGYYERHHIIPKSIGGTNTPGNIVCLSGREHFICHMLLVRMVVSSSHKEKMAYAAWQQARSNSSTSHLYEAARKALAKHYTGRKRKPFSPEHREHMRISALRRAPTPISESQLQHLKSLGQRDKTGIKNPFFGKTHSVTVRAQLSLRNSTSFFTCPHCGKTGASAVMKRWHFDRCRHKQSTGLIE